MSIILVDLLLEEDQKEKVKAREGRWIDMVVSNQFAESGRRQVLANAKIVTISIFTLVLLWCPALSAAPVVL